MAKVKLTKNLLKDRDEYTRYFGAFSGVDFSSDHTEVRDDRFAYLKNMYKDYQSGQGEAIETIPGFRRLFTANETLNGIHVFQRYTNGGLEKKVLLHVGDTLWEYDSNFESGECLIKKRSEYEKEYEGWEMVPPYPLIEDSASISVLSGDKMYLFDGVRVNVYNGKRVNIVPDYENIPTTYINAVTLGSTFMYEGSMGAVRQRGKYQTIAGRDGASIGVEHEQRNLMTPWYKMSFVAQDYEDTNCFQLNTKAYQYERTPYYELYCNNESEKDREDYSPGYPETFKVYQYGTMLPWAFFSPDESTWENDPYLIPEGYPNAVVGISKDGVVELVDAPPAPEKNKWDPVNGIKTTDTDISFAYPPGYAGIEISVYKPFENVAGKYVSSESIESIAPLAGCTLSAVHDNRIFLSGHPKYPCTVFYCDVDNDTYFGELNTVQIGVGSSPVTSLLPVANTLMVLKRDTVNDGAVSFLTGQDTDDNVIPRIYAVTPGLPGLGGLGPCCNFFDDPIFISKLGVEAMGQLSVRYERAVEHRSSLIDAALLGCNLEKASIVEWGGYMLILIEGRVFMADYRQRFSHSSGVTQYEWYYLEDIGVYDGQYERYVYSRFPHVGLGGMEIDGMDLIEEESLIGETANPPDAEGKDPQTVKSYTDDNGNVIYYVERDGSAVFCELSGAVDGVDFYPEYIGGKFDPAAKLFTVGEDLYFATEGGVVCKFNFDKRDPETRTIPNRWYTFDDRAIESGAAIKMDNCGIPHLTKDTVKRSTVFKTRSSDKSTAKIYVRTNKSPYKQIDRLIGGTASFEAADFIDITFGSVDDDKTLFSVRERERGWIEKQYFIKSDEFMRPFALYYIVYCYHVAGRYKE